MVAAGSAGASGHGMCRVALTGGIATGKSYVRAAFDKLGVPTIDADVLAHEAVAPGTAGLSAVVHRFGVGILDAEGALDRRRLGVIVFGDPEARRALEAIVHPDVRRATDQWFVSMAQEKHPFAIADIPLLYEVGRDRAFDVVIVAACHAETQLRRVMERYGMSTTVAHQRIDAQILVEEKARRADYVIHTDGSYADTDRQVREVWQALRARCEKRPTTE